MYTKLFKLLLQNSHLGADGAAVLQQFLVISPHAAEGNVTFEPSHWFVIRLQDEAEEKQGVKRKRYFYRFYSLTLYSLYSFQGYLSFSLVLQIWLKLIWFDWKQLNKHNYKTLLSIVFN